VSPIIGFNFGPTPFFPNTQTDMQGSPIKRSSPFIFMIEGAQERFAFCITFHYGSTPFKTSSFVFPPRTSSKKWEVFKSNKKFSAKQNIQTHNPAL